MDAASVTELQAYLRQNQSLAEILERFDEIALPDSWLVAGSIAQTIWNLRCDQPAEQGIKDVDLIYFDGRDFSVDAEAGHERRIRDLFRHLPIKLDVKNEARVHLWYQERFGYGIRPYRSSTDAIVTFPTTATAIGVRRTYGEFEYCAPFGLDDLFSLVVRPNKKQITRAIYEAKIERWRSLWPRLTIVPWERMAASASSAVRA
ncbi:MAG: nucleotidyltransferase family protein [Alphaproteobacteria bacterium]|nr:nucleotidyltransferase family protein [Alphaproteobacteria bacterium]